MIQLDGQADYPDWKTYYLASVNSKGNRNIGSVISDAVSRRARLFHPFYAAARHLEYTSSNGPNYYDFRVLTHFGWNEVQPNADATVEKFGRLGSNTAGTSEYNTGPQLTQYIRWLHETIRNN